MRPLLARRAGALLLCVILAGCASSTAERRPRPVAAAPARQKTRPARVPRTFYGLASYYSNSLAGRPTSTGERYDPARYTAASRDLPFGTLVRVTNRDSGEHVVVRINDRGPFGDARRVLDLSYAAARELGILSKGVASVRVEVIELGKSNAARTGHD